MANTFDEKELRQAIANQWGEYGAHTDLFDTILKINSVYKKELERIVDKYGYEQTEDVLTNPLTPSESDVAEQEDIEKLANELYPNSFKLASHRHITPSIKKQAKLKKAWIAGYKVAQQKYTITKK